MNIIQKESPNYSKRLPNYKINCIVLHYTATSGVASPISWFLKKESQVSAHYIISKEGDIYQCVPEQFKAWHAGVSALNNEEDVNQFSIGIELVNTGSEPYGNKQMNALVELVFDIMVRNPDITVERIVGHEDICPNRKSDPGKYFDWGWFRSKLQEELGSIGWKKL